MSYNEKKTPPTAAMILSDQNFFKESKRGPPNIYAK